MIVVSKAKPRTNSVMFKWFIESSHRALKIHWGFWEHSTGGHFCQRQAVLVVVI